MGRSPLEAVWGDWDKASSGMTARFLCGYSQLGLALLPPRTPNRTGRRRMSLASFWPLATRQWSLPTASAARLCWRRTKS